LHEAVDCRIEDDELTKPGVALTLFTTPTEMMLSIRSLVPLQPLLFSLPGIGLAAAAGSRSNHLVDRRIDGTTERTRYRPPQSGAPGRARPSRLSTSACLQRTLRSVPSGLQEMSNCCCRPGKVGD
jgi:heme O synthase-like polyprenyltransferase